MTRIAVTAAAGRARLSLTQGPVMARVQHSDPFGARVAMVATTALLLGGDHVELDVDVGPGAWLEVVEIAGTVAYDADEEASSWSIRARLAQDALLVWLGEPFVVATGANVTRTTRLSMEAGAAACLRETLVLGRTGEVGGALSSTTHVTTQGRDLLFEQMELPDEEARRAPGMLGDARVLDTLAMLGLRAPADPTVPAGMRFDLAGQGTLVRALATSTDRTGVRDLIGPWRNALAAHRKALV